MVNLNWMHFYAPSPGNTCSYWCSVANILQRLPIFPLGRSPAVYLHSSAIQMSQPSSAIHDIYIWWKHLTMLSAHPGLIWNLILRGLDLSSIYFPSWPWKCIICIFQIWAMVRAWGWSGTPCSEGFNGTHQLYNYTIWYTMRVTRKFAIWRGQLYFKAISVNLKSLFRMFFSEINNSRLMKQIARCMMSIYGFSSEKSAQGVKGHWPRSEICCIRLHVVADSINGNT